MKELLNNTHTHTQVCSSVTLWWQTKSATTPEIFCNAIQKQKCNFEVISYMSSFIEEIVKKKTKKNRRKEIGKRLKTQTNLLSIKKHLHDYHYLHMINNKPGLHKIENIKINDFCCCLFFSCCFSVFRLVFWLPISCCEQDLILFCTWFFF